MGDVPFLDERNRRPRTQFCDRSDERATFHAYYRANDVRLPLQSWYGPDAQRYYGALAAELREMSPELEPTRVEIVPALEVTVEGLRGKPEVVHRGRLSWARLPHDPYREPLEQAPPCAVIVRTATADDERRGRRGRCRERVTRWLYTIALAYHWYGVFRPVSRGHRTLHDALERLDCVRPDDHLERRKARPTRLLD